MCRTLPAAIVLTTLAVVGAGCGSEEDGASVAVETTGTESTAAPSGTEVPEGVAVQYATIEDEVAAEGGETESGPWRIAYIVEPAEPWFVDGRFREPAARETHHIEILPIEAETGRLVPEVPIRLEVIDSNRKVVDGKELDFFYSDEFFHYASNFSVPESGTYTLRATLDAPDFPRHGEEGEAPALAEGAEVTFDDVELAG